MSMRHEWKHEINHADMLLLRQRLRTVMQEDPNGVQGKYEVRSLYFDNAADRVLLEKVYGIKCREKFRIRYYNFDTSRILLEKKSKYNGLGTKQSEVLTSQQALAIVHGDWDWMMKSKAELIQELYTKLLTQGLRAKTIVDYTREAFVYGPGNVRVTLDYHIRTGLRGIDFLNPACIMIPAGDNTAIMEVKWDAYLPDIIKDLVQLQGRRTSSFSKYQICRMYG